jgi:hypothetical protein
MIECSFKGIHRIWTPYHLKMKKDLIFGTLWYKKTQDVEHCPEHYWSFLKYTVVRIFQSCIIYLFVVYFTTLSVTQRHTVWSEWVIERTCKGCTWRRSWPDFYALSRRFPGETENTARNVWVGIVAAFDEIRTGNSRLQVSPDLHSLKLRSFGYVQRLLLVNCIWFNLWMVGARWQLFNKLFCHLHYRTLLTVRVNAA